MSIRNKLKYFLFIALAFILSCGDIKLEEKNVDIYSICLGEFKSFDDADRFKSKIDFKLWNNLNIEQADEKRFVLAFGSYKTAFDAGKAAFDLFQKSLIDNYKIIKNNNATTDFFINLFYVAKYQGRPSVYSYNIKEKKSKLYWSRWGRKVISAFHSPVRNSVFIITALGYGKQGSFPYVKDARLYYFNEGTAQIDEIEEFGDGLQIYSYWEKKDTFKINFTKVDSVNSSIVKQTIYAFDGSGGKCLTKQREYNLTESGFPKPPESKPTMFSVKGTYQLRITSDSEGNSLYLRDVVKNAQVLISEYKGIIKNIVWTEDEKFLFIITGSSRNKNNNNKDELLIVNTPDKKTIRSFTGPAYKDLLVRGNLLFFDQQFEGVSQITVYDFSTDLLYDEIRPSGGCGINDLFY